MRHTEVIVLYFDNSLEIKKKNPKPFYDQECQLDIYILCESNLLISVGRDQMVNFLIAKGVAMNVKCKRGWTSLHTAAFKGVKIDYCIFSLYN